MADIRAMTTSSRMDLPSALAVSEETGKEKAKRMIRNTLGEKYVPIIEELFEDVQGMSENQLSDAMFLTMDFLLLAIMSDDAQKYLNVEYRAAQENEDPIVVRWVM